MRKRLNRYVAVVLAILLFCQLLIGCSSESSSLPTGNNEISGQVINEEHIFEDNIAEEKLNEAFIAENMLYEDGIYEYEVSEDIISEAYTFEITVGEQTEAEILAELPEEIEDYEIDWPKVIGKFAVGTVIIIVVGVVGHVTKGGSYFVFGSPATVAKEALISGAMGVAINEVIGSLKKGLMPAKGVTKYAIEGFADGYMWGAITSVLKTAHKHFKRLKAFKCASGGQGSIKPDGRVFDEAGKLIGRAYYEKKGIWYIVDEDSRILQVFDKNGKEITETGILATIKSLPKKTKLRLGTAEEVKICCTDDVGKLYRMGDELMPNITYQLNEYTYYTDDLGRVSKVVFNDLKLKPEGRPRFDIIDSKNVIGRGFEQSSDDRGHLIADIFDGDNTMANIVPQASKVNQGPVKAIEMGWKNVLETGGHVKGSIEISYSGESYRPDLFKYTYDMGSGIVKRFISNGL